MYNQIQTYYSGASNGKMMTPMEGVVLLAECLLGALVGIFALALFFKFIRWKPISSKAKKIEYGKINGDAKVLKYFLNDEEEGIYKTLNSLYAGTYIFHPKLHLDDFVIGDANASRYVVSFGILDAKDLRLMGLIQLAGGQDLSKIDFGVPYIELENIGNRTPADIKQQIDYAIRNYGEGSKRASTNYRAVGRPAPAKKPVSKELQPETAAPARISGPDTRIIGSGDDMVEKL